MARKINRKSEERYQSNADDFIPYACHFDEQTLLTKNGELVQIIKVTGFNFETVKSGDDTKLDLREELRKAILDNIPDDSYAFWIHTVRRKRDISSGGIYQKGFSKTLNESWIKRNDWNNQYVNELFVTVLVEGETLSISNLKFFFETLYASKNFKKINKRLTQSHEKLQKVSDGILKSLEAYGAKKLGLEKVEGIYYSELANFASKIINLREEKIPVMPIELSSMLASNKAQFQFNTVEVIGEDFKNYGAIFSVKEYRDISTKYIDQFLQLPIQFIVSESFNYSNSKKALESFKDQKKLLDLSQDTMLARASGLKDIVEADKGRSTDFGEHQITITVLESSVKKLHEGISLLVDELRDLGIIFVREDIFMEDCYWSQLPANFDFIKRVTYLATNKIGGYASLYNFPAGKMDGNLWGPAVTVFHTANDTPYFFNFHYHDNGHTSIIGPYGSGKTVLMNFLVSEAQKFRPRVFYFDLDRSSEIFIRSLEGSYSRVHYDVEKGNISLNPLLLDDTAENRAFLADWFHYLVEYYPDKEEEPSEANNIEASREVTDIDKKYFRIAAEYTFSLPKEKRILAEIVEHVWGKNYQAEPEIEEEYKILKLWINNPKYSKFFNNNSDTIDFSKNRIFAFDMTNVANNRALMVSVVSYLLHRIEISLNGSPTMIVLDHAWTLIDFPAFVPRLEGWLDRLRRKNAMVIFATESVEQAETSSVTKTLIDKLETQIFLPNPKLTEAYKTVFGLSEYEYAELSKINSKKREFLLKHNVDAVRAKLSLQGMGYELAILSSNRESLALMESTIKEVGESPEKWLPELRKRLKL
jgi:type IV secretion system protein VirB4